MSYPHPGLSTPSDLAMQGSTVMRQSRADTLVTEEPDALIAHVRVCGGAGWVTTGSTRNRLLAPVAHDVEPFPTLFPAPALPGGFPAPRQHTDAPLAPPRSVLAPAVAANAPRVALVRLARPVRPRDSILRTPGRGPA